MVHLSKGFKGQMRYDKKIPETLVTNEVHLYSAAKTAVIEGEPMLLSLDSLLRIEILEHDKGRTTGSYIGGGILIGLSVIAFAAIIVAATKSSCPFVSGFDGEMHSLQGELFGGAIYPQLARNDYIPLRLGKTKEGNYEVIISNELKEKQFTDLADLWVIHHDKSIRVIADESGNLYSISNPETPVSAKMTNQPDPLPMIAECNDNRVFYFSDTSSKDGVNELKVQFKNQPGRKKAKLILRLKNSYFLDYLYGDMASNLGKHYASYMKKQEKRPAAELKKWVNEQKIPLEVSVKKENTWQSQALLTTIGPLEFREVVVPLDLTNTANEFIELSFKTGFMFWEIDAIAIDYTEGENYYIEKIKPLSAIDEKGNDVMKTLLQADNIYLEQPEIGNMATMVYKPDPTKKSEARSFILHTRGYYKHLRDFKGKANIKFLKQFKKPNAFAKYGIEKYKIVQNRERDRIAKLSTN